MVVSVDISGNSSSPVSGVTVVALAPSVQASQVTYIVESSTGELLLVQRKLIVDQSDHNQRITSRFKIFKPQFRPSGEADRVEVKNRGGDALFLGDKYSMAVLARDFPGCQPNSIYFTDDYFILFHNEFYKHDELGIFNIDDGKSERFCNLDHPEKFSAVVEPTMLQCHESTYIVESSAGELILIHRYMVPVGDSENPNFSFRIFKLQFNSSERVELESLGGDALFLSDNHSIAVLASDFLVCQPNSMYFTDTCEAKVVAEPRMFRRCDKFSMAILASDFSGCRPNSINFTNDYIREQLSDFRDIDVWIDGSFRRLYNTNCSQVPCLWILPTLQGYTSSFE
ncbi:unnamed protein product [Ilex paraguariensis]|uniref:KIB1-4 beta-propeller domain-containing protein n=1 Tax=Ilex paraguariensis TaxID=185542 RepID=A0ABC8RCI3_9AQUA